MYELKEQDTCLQNVSQRLEIYIFLVYVSSVLCFATPELKERMFPFLCQVRSCVISHDLVQYLHLSYVALWLVFTPLQLS